MVSVLNLIANNRTMSIFSITGMIIPWCEKRGSLLEERKSNRKKLGDLCFYGILVYYKGIVGGII